MRFETNSIPARFSKRGRIALKLAARECWMTMSIGGKRSRLNLECGNSNCLLGYPLFRWFTATKGEGMGRKSFGESRVTGGFCMQLWVTALLKAIHSAYKLLIFLRQKVGRRCAPESWLFGTSCRDKSRRTTPLKFDGQLASWDGILFLAS